MVIKCLLQCYARDLKKNTQDNVFREKVDKKLKKKKNRKKRKKKKSLTVKTIVHF